MKNKLIEEQINFGKHQTMSMSQIYYENNMICTKIFELERSLLELQNKRNVSFIPYLQNNSQKQNDIQIFFSFVGRFYEKIRNKDLLKEGIKFFEQMKDDIMKNLEQKSSWDDIYNRVQNRNLIQNKIEEKINESLSK